MLQKNDPKRNFLTLKRLVSVSGILLLSLMILASAVNAQSANANANSFGKGRPTTLNELPPGQLLRDLNKLPGKARENALRWLQGFSFPGSDVAYLRADPKGAIFYVDPAVDATGVITNSETSETVLSEITAAKTFTLHSKPGAGRTVYLDMDGHVVSGTVWNYNAGVATFYMLPYDLDGDTTTFNSTELEHIAEVWKRVAEDYAPFDIDVTTEKPVSFGPNVGHILVSPRIDQDGNAIYGAGAGGVAYVDVWGGSNYPYYQPALVFPENLSYGTHYISEAASHELGHNLSLSHDGTTADGYYEGHGSGATDWGPIMGVGYYANITQWSKGEYPDANNSQDDLNIIQGHLTYRTDDHEDLHFANATALVRSGSTNIVSTTPVTDPDNLATGNKGIIEDRQDIDLFFLDVGPGLIDLTVSPGWIEAYSTDSTRRGMNPDLQVTLYNESGDIVAIDDPEDETDAWISVNVDAGRYILAVEGVGFGNPPADGYSDYGSLGQYFINGTVPQEQVYTAAPAAPTNLAASLAGEDSIYLTWTDPPSLPGTNESGYKVLKSTDGGDFEECANIAKDSEEYTDIAPGNGIFSYQLEAYNSIGGTLSNATSPIEIQLFIVAVASAETTYLGLVNSGSYNDTTVIAGSEQLIEAHQGGKPSKRISSLEHVWIISGVEPGELVTLEISASAATNDDNDNFEFSYSLDNGNTYFFVGELSNGDTETMITDLPSDTSGTVLIRVKDTDQTTGYASADTVNISHISITSSGMPDEQKPVVTITAPDNGSSFNLGDGITFSATASDYEDGDLSTSIQWESDLDGSLGTGASLFEVTHLQEGTHSITATVTDGNFKTTVTSITIDVTQPGLETPMIVSDLTAYGEVTKNKWTAHVTAVVEAESSDSGLRDFVSGAVVSGVWGDGSTSSCISDNDGNCFLSKGNLNIKAYPSITFDVTGVTCDDYNYEGGDFTTVTVWPSE